MAARDPNRWLKAWHGHGKTLDDLAAVLAVDHADGHAGVREGAAGDIDAHGPFLASRAPGAKYFLLIDIRYLIHGGKYRTDMEKRNMENPDLSGKSRYNEEPICDLNHLRIIDLGFPGSSR